MLKNVKNVESDVQVFTFHFEIANEHFHCKTITHCWACIQALINEYCIVLYCTHHTQVMLYIQHYIKTLHFWLKYNGFVTVRKTTKLIESGNRGFQDYRHASTFFYVFNVFFLKIQKVVTFYVFCRASYVFSNYGRASSMGEQVSSLSHSAVCTTIVGSKCIFSHGLIQQKWPELSLPFMVFQMSKSLVVHGTASSMGDKVSR